jgi:hypothetical protein
VDNGRVDTDAYSTGMPSSSSASVLFIAAITLVILPALAKEKLNGYVELGQSDEVGPMSLCIPGAAC